VYICVEQVGGFYLPFLTVGMIIILIGIISDFVLPSQKGKSRFIAIFGFFRMAAVAIFDYSG